MENDEMNKNTVLDAEDIIDAEYADATDDGTAEQDLTPIPGPNGPTWPAHPDRLVESTEQTPEGVEGVNASELDDFWKRLDDDDADVMTTLWFCDISFEVPEKGIARDVFACTTKAKIVNRIFAIISSPDINAKDFNVNDFTTKSLAIRAFFEGVDGRNLFIALIPVF